MRGLRSISLVGLGFLGMTCGLALADPVDEALAAVRPDAIRAEMRYLSDDLLEGRGTGARGHQLAAHYVASQFEAMGLAPAGEDGSYYQQVPIRQSRVNERGLSVVIAHGAQSSPLVYKQDFLIDPDPGRHESEVDAPVVFVGYGITAPSLKYDDYKGLDVKGKIVAVLFGAPNFPAAVKAHYSASWLKRRMAVDHGAIGYMLIYSSKLEDMSPFAARVRNSDIPKLNWVDGAGQANDYFSQLKVVSTISMPGAEKLFAGSRQTAEQVFAADKAGKVKGFALAQSAHLKSATEWTDIKSPNVVAKLEGSDATLKQQFVVYSAHLDHLGISAPVNGDSIYNGALDNASGTAVMMEVARSLSAMRVKPKRSFVFVAVTGEEGGLIGSGYYAQRPTVPTQSIVANVNMDEDVMLWPLKDVVALGAEHSSLANVVDRAAQKVGIIASPDPQPEQVAFVRSDQYSFVRHGVPAFSLSAGWKSDDPAIDPKAINEQWDHQIYHHPGDDMNQPRLDFDAAALYAKVALLCGIYTADDAQPPQWNPGDFFGLSFPREH